jgi:hypothetical protein
VLSDHNNSAISLVRMRTAAFKRQKRTHPSKQCPQKPSEAAINERLYGVQVCRADTRERATKPPTKCCCSPQQSRGRDRCSPTAQAISTAGPLVLRDCSQRIRGLFRNRVGCRQAECGSGLTNARPGRARIRTAYRDGLWLNASDDRLRRCPRLLCGRGRAALPLALAGVRTGFKYGSKTLGALPAAWSSFQSRAGWSSRSGAGLEQLYSGLPAEPCAYSHAQFRLLDTSVSFVAGPDPRCTRDGPIEGPSVCGQAQHVLTWGTGASGRHGRERVIGSRARGPGVSVVSVVSVVSGPMGSQDTTSCPSARSSLLLFIQYSHWVRSGTGECGLAPCLVWCRARASNAICYVYQRYSAMYHNTRPASRWSCLPLQTSKIAAINPGPRWAANVGVWRSAAKQEAKTQKEIKRKYIFTCALFPLSFSHLTRE